MWATPCNDNKIVRKFKSFTNEHVTKVKAVIQPMGGHSFNPSASAHKQVLSQVLKEEKTEVERDMKDSLKQQDFERLANIVHQEANSAEESSDGENGIELTGKPVDRLKKKTKM